MSTVLLVGDPAGNSQFPPIGASFSCLECQLASRLTSFLVVNSCRVDTTERRLLSLKHQNDARDAGCPISGQSVSPGKWVSG